jgi:hypothetical protein
MKFNEVNDSVVKGGRAPSRSSRNPLSMQFDESAMFKHNPNDSSIAS